MVYFHLLISIVIGSISCLGTIEASIRVFYYPSLEKQIITIMRRFVTVYCKEIDTKEEKVVARVAKIQY